MTESEFRDLLKVGETDCLDFKQDGYGDLSNSKSRNEFIKDLLAMANTPREIPARIVLGVAWTAESGSRVIGLESQLDDQRFQSAIGTDRVQPIPRFIYKPINFEGKFVGVVEVPVDERGPFTPVKDFEGLQAGAIYTRRGTTCERAVGDEIQRVVRWFQRGEINAPQDYPRNWWEPFLDSVHRFNSGFSYILVTDRVDSTLAGVAHALGIAPWRAVIDFDPESDSTGLLSQVAGTLEHRRTVHRVARGEYKVRPEPGIHWFFARGISGRKETLVGDDHRAWLKAYKRELSLQLQAVSAAINPSPVLAVILCDDSLLKNHFRTMLEELTGSFGESLEVVLVSQDEASFCDLSEEAGAVFLKISRRSLFSGLAVHFADQEAAQGAERFVLNNSTGASIEFSKRDWLWLSEDLELLHRGIGMAGEDAPDGFRRGADVSWRNLQLNHDCDRDVTAQLRIQVEEDIRRRQTVRVNLYHSPGGGGTTVGRRVAWDIHKTSPVCLLTRNCGRETADKIAKVAALTESTVLVLIDGGQHSEREIDDLYGYLKAAQTPAVLLQVLRRFKYHGTGRRQFWVDEELSDLEADRFRVAYTVAAPLKTGEIDSIARLKGHDRTAFFFGLTAFERDFRGLASYVRTRTEDLSTDQRKVLIFLAIAHYYGQQAIPAQAFAPILGISQKRVIDLRGVFSGSSERSLDLLVESHGGAWRTGHPLIALEIMMRFLTPGESLDRENVWRQNLSKWSKEFADLCSDNGNANSDILLELARRVFIYRDNTEVLGTERAASKNFSQLIDDIPSISGRVDVLRHLTDCFPHEAHFHAHLGRFLGVTGDYSGALEAIDYALSIESEDPVLHHMRGMALRLKLKGAAEDGASINELIDISKEASYSFERARSFAPDLEHGYISEIQLLLELVDRAKMTDVSSPASNPYLKEALDRAEDLLDQLQHLYAGEEPSKYALDCQAKLSRLYGDFSKALQDWDSLLARPEVSKPPVRRQIVWTILRRHDRKWENLSRKEVQRVQRLLEENLEENFNDSTSLRLWLRAIRYSQTSPTLDALSERIGYWKANTGSLDAAFYLYALHFLRSMQGSSHALLDAERALEECKALARYRRDRTRSFEWIGNNAGIHGLVHQSQLGEWRDDFWESTKPLRRVNGIVTSIDGPQKGIVQIDGGINAFFVPAKSDFHEGKDENAAVTCFIGLSYDGPRAWDVKLLQGDS